LLKLIPVRANGPETMRGRSKSGDGDPEQRLLRSGEARFSLVEYRHATTREISRQSNVG
jgi:hypothetical protein